MCLAVVLFSLIPILSGYAVYLVVATTITRGSPALQLTLAVLLVALMFWGGGQLLRRWQRSQAARPLKSEEAER